MAGSANKATQSPVASDPPEAARIDDASPARSKALTEGGQGKATVRTGWPYDSFASGVKDVPVITSTGVEVDRSKVKALLEAAKSAGVPLEEV